MVLQDFLLFLTIQAAMALFALAEAYQEGKHGWKYNHRWFSVPLPGGYWLHAYHVFIFLGIFPLFLFVIPLLLVGWNTHLFLVILFSFLMGLVLEDFLWFVVNPQFSFKKWKPKYVRWYPWVQIGTVAIPLGYLVVLLLSSILLFFIL